MTETRNDEFKPDGYSATCPTCFYPHDFNTATDAEDADFAWRARVLEYATYLRKLTKRG